MESPFEPYSNFTDQFYRLSAMDREIKFPRFEINETLYSYVIRVFRVTTHMDELSVEAPLDDRRSIRFSWKESVMEKERKVDLVKGMIHRIETRSDKFSRIFRLPENAIVDEMTATVENGVLIVTIPKRRARAVVDRPPPESMVGADQPPQHHVIGIFA